MGGFVLKVKTNKGQHVVDILSAEETIRSLKAKISEITCIPPESLSVLIGFPPKPVDLSVEENTVAATGIKNGDSLIVEERPAQDVVATAAFQHLEERNLPLQVMEETSSVAQNKSDGILLKQVVPSDNSCLFTSIGNA